MNTTNVCPECGAIVPASAPLGLCRRCLQKGSASEDTTQGPIEKPTVVATGPAIVDWKEALRVIGELDLIPADELDRFASSAGDDPSRLARALVQAKLLTPYQTKALLKGKARGLVIGRYLVESKLGDGGMGVVFKAKDRSTGRVIALKILPPSFAREPDAVRRFRREFQIASRLSHPNLVKAIEASEDRGVHYLTMEYIPGQTLHDLVSRGGPLAIKLALHCAVQTARGLEAAHAQGVVHRDIKPGNVMIDPAGAVRVLDLGLARVIEATSQLGRSEAGSLTRTGTYMGTVDFLAPEQANDAKSADGRSDIYSLGCTIYFLLTGKPPFQAETVLRRLMAHQDRPAPSLRISRPEVTEAMEEIYQRMMAKRPSDRPRTMSEVIMDLEACRTSALEGGDAGDELRTFARTILKRAPARGRRGPDASIFAQPAAGSDELSFDPDLDLEDLVAGYRDEVGRKPIPEEKLPPIVRRPLAPSQRRRSAPPHASTGLALIGCLIAGFTFWPRAKPVDPGSVPTTEAVVAATATPKIDDQGPVNGVFQMMPDPDGIRPTLLAYRRPKVPVADGVILPDEYGPGVEVDFTADSRFGALGSGMGDPSLSKTADDLSVKIHAGYTEMSLFLAFKVRDQFVDAQEADKNQPFLNDCVELFLDGDRVQNDFLPAPVGRQASPEGFQIIADAAGHRITLSRDLTNRDWKAASKLAEGGYVVEFEIPLAIIDVHDGPQKAPAGPGSLIHFGMAIDDNDSETSRQQMSYAYLRARKDVGMPLFGLEVAWTLGIKLSESSLHADGSPADLASPGDPKIFAVADFDTLSVFYKEGARLSDLDNLLEAVGLLKQAMALLRKLVAEHPERADYRSALGVHCNRLSAHYSTYLDAQFRNPRLAVELSNEAVKLLPDDYITWEKLGWARYRVGDWKGCIEAIGKPAAIESRSGWNLFFLAMAHNQLGDQAHAGEYYNQAVAWLDARPAGDLSVKKARRIRDEAASVLEIPVKR